MSRLGLFLLPFIFFACDLAPASNPNRHPKPPGDASTGNDGQDASNDSTNGSYDCDPEAEETGCQEGEFCDTRARVCVECISYRERCVGSPERAKREKCEPPVVSPDGSLISGGFFEPMPCDNNLVCVEESLRSSLCLPKVCEPNFATCESGTLAKACNASGTNLHETDCVAGRACYSGECLPVRHNVMLIFDTSGSMWSYLDPQYRGTPFTCRANQTPCIDDFPLCENPEEPLTLLGMSKKVFSSVVDEALGQYSQFALQRFPQYESPVNTAGCMVGWYNMVERMEGDDDAVNTELDSWFTDHLSQVLAVPFPVRVTLDNAAAIQSWMDNREELAATPKECSKNDDCGSRGKCGNYNGEKRCFEHSNPELRAGGLTPLGKSLFYAAEYIRRFVRVDGKSCTNDASCGSSGYQCLDGVCLDPYRYCKDDYIVLFTDGGESEYTDESEFFNPVVQAKRLAYGLHCEEKADCRGGARCEDGICLGPGQTASMFKALDVPEGGNALSSPNGFPISIKTTVITLDGEGYLNERIALGSGGINVDVSSGDPESFKTALYEAMTPNYKCQPEELEDLLEEFKKD